MSRQIAVCTHSNTKMEYQHMHIYTIYKATNITNNKCYIGFDSNWPKRKTDHKSESHKNDKIFHKAIRKYGWENFSWEILYQSFDYDYTKNTMETHFIIEYKSFVGFIDCNGYNATMGGEGTRGIKHSNERKQYQSQVMTNLRNDKNSIYNSLEYKEKQKQIRNSKEYKEKHKKSCNAPESIERNSNAIKSMWADKNSIFNTKEYRHNLANSISKTYIITCPDGKEIKIKNLSEFCKENNLHSGCMVHVAKGRQKIHKGYICRYC